MEIDVERKKIEERYLIAVRRDKGIEQELLEKLNDPKKPSLGPGDEQHVLQSIRIISKAVERNLPDFESSSDISITDLWRWVSVLESIHGGNFELLVDAMRQIADEALAGSWHEKTFGIKSDTGYITLSQAVELRFALAICKLPKSELYKMTTEEIQSAIRVLNSVNYWLEPIPDTEGKNILGLKDALVESTEAFLYLKASKSLEELFC